MNMRLRTKNRYDWRRRFALLPIRIDHVLVWLEFYEWRHHNGSGGTTNIQYDYRLGV